MWFIYGSALYNQIMYLKKSEVKNVFTEMLKINDRPVLIDCVVDPEDMVFPMVPAGGSNDQIILNEEDLKNL